MPGAMTQATPSYGPLRQQSNRNRQPSITQYYYLLSLSTTSAFFDLANRNLSTSSISLLPNTSLETFNSCLTSLALAASRCR